MEAESKAIEDAVNTVLNEGYRTADIYTQGTIQLTCSEMGDKIVSKL